VEGCLVFGMADTLPIAERLTAGFFVSVYLLGTVLF
jgi:hypothetical protein